MKYTIFLILLVAGAAVSAAAQQEYKTYTNDRFGFSVAYPADYKAGEEPENDDGLVFTSPDGTAEIRVWAGYNVLDQDLNAKLSSDSAAVDGKIKYHLIKNNNGYFSSEKDGMIYYQRTLFRVNSEVFYNVRIRYPKSQKKNFDAVVKRVVESLRYDPTFEV